MSAKNDHHHTTKLLCQDIKRLFIRRSKHNKHNNHEQTIEAKKLLVAKARRSVDEIVSSGANKSETIASILRALDDVDIKELQSMSSRVKKKKLKTRKKLLLDSSHTPAKRRRRLSTNTTNSILHDTKDNIDSDDDDEQPKLYLSNSDRYRRAKRSQMQHSSMSISMKDVINAPAAPKQSEEDEDDMSDDMVTTLILDAAMLRRDLYKHLSELDTANIKAVVEENKYTRAQNGDTLQAAIKDLTSTLFQRICANPESPSMRLSTIITLDYLRELDLSDMGYRSILDELLGAIISDGSLSFYAEIVCECHTFENPLRLIKAIKLLMHRALDEQNLENNGKCAKILRAISYIAVHRQSVLSSFNHDTKVSSLLTNEISAYRQLCNTMSITFDSVTHWITPGMPNDIKESIISALQAEGVLSMFCEDVPVSTSKIEEYPYPVCLSLRAAHDRMGPFDGVNRLLSRPVSYEQPILDGLVGNTSTESLEEDDDTNICQFILSDDILINVLSFLNYRSLARVTRVCKSWQQVGDDTQRLWSGVYFQKYRKRRLKFESELNPGKEVYVARRADNLGNFLSRCYAAENYFATTEQYDWKYIFKYKYEKERICKRKTCNIIGCLYVIKRPDYHLSHMKRHESTVRVQRKNLVKHKALQTTVNDLHQQRSNLQITISLEPDQKAKIKRPEDVLRYLVFPYLNYRDVLVFSGVCKLWKELANSNLLWKAVYQHHFDTTCTRWSTPSTFSSAHDWKLLFRSKLLAEQNVRGQVNDLGWAVKICPTVGCNKELRSKFIYDSHLLWHEDRYCTQEITHLKKALKSLQNGKGKGSEK